MIKYESIISSFDDKDTLYNWLRKVEEQLKNASATGFVVNKKGNATLSFSITFANGETLESGDIILQQGESVDGARIASGVLQLHLTNGTWLTAGNLGAVSSFSINASQHLIVNYQDGTSQDLGAIFNGNISISGNLIVTGTTGINGQTIIDDDFAVTGNAQVNGNLLVQNGISASSIIEIMNGYAYSQGATTTGSTKQIDYASVVKNGNKVTFVIAGFITRTSDTFTADAKIGNFYMPNEIMTKLVPTTISGVPMLDVRTMDIYKTYTAHVNVDTFIEKGSTGIYFTLVVNANMELNTPYYFRKEVTFLLSDNMAGA